MSSSVAKPLPSIRISSEVHARVAAATDTGRVRERNEDAVLVRDFGGEPDRRESGVGAADPQRVVIGPRGLLLAVADGMGGAAHGDVASAMVVDHLARSLEAAPIEEPPEVSLARAVKVAHEAVWSFSHDAPDGHRRMGSTLTAALVHHDTATIAQVGDSRAYVLRGGAMIQVTHDQSLVQVLVDAGVMEPEQANESPHRNVILQAMGHQEPIQPSISKLALRDRDCLLLCSDGLCGLVHDREILRTIRRSFRLDIATERLVALANERGGDDNISVILAGVGGALPPLVPDEPFGTTLKIISSFVPKLPG